jgi:hypothetical protein
MLKQVTVVTSIMPLRNDPFSVYFPMSASNSDNVYDPPRHLFPDLHLLVLPLPDCCPCISPFRCPVLIYDFITPTKCIIVSQNQSSFESIYHTLFV